MKRLKLKAEDLVLVYTDTGKLAGVYDDKTPLEKLPQNTIAVPSQPDNGLDTYDFKAQLWIPYEAPYDVKRKKEYTTELGTPEDQFDAIYKGLEIIIPALVEGRALTAEEASLLVPDKTKPADTPAGWRGKVKEIKERNPKP